MSNTRDRRKERRAHAPCEPEAAQPSRKEIEKQQTALLEVRSFRKCLAAPPRANAAARRNNGRTRSKRSENSPSVLNIVAA